VSLDPVPGPQITPSGKLTPLWQSWFYKLFQFVTGALSPASVNAGGAVIAGTYLKSGAVLVVNLPAATTVGMGADYMVTDATVTTFASIVAGGGTNIVPVYSDGTAWRIG